MEKYTNILKTSGAYAWEVVCTKTKGWEFYFIGHRLDQNRAKDVEKVTLKVYKLAEDGSMGMASASVPPTESEEGVAKTVADLVYQAGLVKNRPYRLNTPKPFEPVDTGLRPLAEEAESFIRAMDGIAETETEDLNSYEIFTSQVERRLVNSEGVDVTEVYPSSMVDVVVNARDEGHEIELYRLYKLGACDPQLLQKDIGELLQFGKDRLKASPTPAIGKAPVVFSTDAALEIYNYFLDNLNTQYVVRKMSSFEIGKPIAENIEGDRVTLESVRILKDSPGNFACDPEGAPIKDAVLLKDSVPAMYVGGRMFSQYLGLEDSFMVSNWKVSGGTRSAEELRSGRFLEIVEFSDFQVDSITGDIFGEIRLGYWHDGENPAVPVSGGSISGNMAENLGCMYMSRESRRFSDALIPAVTRLENITVSGVE